MAHPKSKELVIFGIGEMASMAHFYFKEDSAYKVVAFSVDDEFATTPEFEGLPVVPFSKVKERYPPAKFEMHVALAYRKLNQIRRDKYLSAKAAGYKLASYVSSKSVFWSDLSIGDNCLILENQTIQPKVKIGNNVMIWSGNHLGHGCVVEDHVYISSHVCISGQAEIGSLSFIGVNATVRDYAKIGKSCFIAMCAAITRDVPDGSVVVGAKSTTFEADTDTAKSLMKKYFFS
jgi:sugar O-acyltransferase (sialic acid O-acetyltransferase NeuD family)